MIFTCTSKTVDKYQRTISKTDIHPEFIKSYKNLWKKSGFNEFLYRESVSDYA
jgi:hypothetical protein